LVIFGDRKVLDFVWVGEVVDALLLAQSKHWAGNIVNIGSGYGVTLSELATRIVDGTSSSSPLQFARARSGEVDQFVADIQLAKELGHHPAADSLGNLSEVIQSTSASDKSLLP
jgi:nucleoside-diphosphate-sugar epimerase